MNTMKAQLSGLRRFALFSLFLLLAVLIRPLQAANAVVGTGTSASCTEAAFNTALSTVQASSSGTVTFNCGGAATIVFTTSKIISNTAVTISGGSNITLSGANAIRPFYVESNATLTLQNITVSNGLDNTYGGGAILSLGKLTLENTTIRDSNVDPAYSGGAIMSLGGLVTITNSLIENNSGGSAGGLYLLGETADATISGSTFRNNRAINFTYGYGGAITAWDGADVTVNGSTFEQNEAREGGGIFNASGNVAVSEVTLTENHASDSGGGIANANGGILTLAKVTFSQNSASGGGGLDNKGQATLTDVTFDANVGSFLGGGLSNSSASALASLVNVTFSHNSASSEGGGISNYGTLNFTNGTISGNSATYSGPGGNFGGGIINLGIATFTHITFSGNSATLGAAIYHAAGDGDTFHIKNSVFNQGAIGSNCEVETGSLSPITSEGFNLSSDGSCSFGETGDRYLVDPMLGPLTNNGGFTQTHMLLPGSPAIDTGQCVSGLITDQRGSPRFQGGACDVGAVERQPDEGIFELYLPMVVR